MYTILKIYVIQVSIKIIHLDLKELVGVIINGDSQIQINKKRYHLGYFINEIDAAAAYNIAALNIMMNLQN